MIHPSLHTNDTCICHGGTSNINTALSVLMRESVFRIAVPQLVAECHGCEACVSAGRILRSPRGTVPWCHLIQPL